MNRNVSPEKLKTIFQNLDNEYLKQNPLSSKSLSLPNDDDMIKLEPILPQLFNLSMEQIDIIKDKSNDTSILNIIASLLHTDVRSIRKFVKYISSIPDGKNKTTDQLKSLMKKKVKLHDLPQDILDQIHKEYIQITAKKNTLFSWREEDSSSSLDSPELNPSFDSPKYVSANKLKQFLKDSVFSPNDDDMIKLEPILPQLFNLSMNQIDIINKDVIILKIIASLLEIDDVKYIKKFIKYIASIPDGKNKTTNELKYLIKNRQRKIQLHDLPQDILGEIYQKYTQIVPKKYKLRDWIRVDKLSIRALSSNPNDKAIEMIKEKVGKRYTEWDKNIDWKKLSKNPNDNAIILFAKYFNQLYVKNGKDVDFLINLLYNPSNEAIKLLEHNQDKINKMTLLYLAKNPNNKAIELLMKKFGNKINEYADSKFWVNLSANPSNKAIEFLLKDENKSKINWKMLSKNPNDKAIELLKQNQDKIDLMHLSTNPNDEAMKLFDELLLSIYPDTTETLINNLSSNTSYIAIVILDNEFLPEEFNWKNLSKNPNDKAIELLKQNQDKINWDSLSENTNEKVLELLKQNQDKINWDSLSANPIIFEEIQNSPFNYYTNQKNK